MTILILSLSKANAFIKKQGGKRGLVEINSLSSIKMIPILLAKMIAVYIRLPRIEVQQLIFERPLPGLYLLLR